MAFNEENFGGDFDQLLRQSLDPVGSTVRYEMMKLCTGSVQDTMRQQQLVIDDNRSAEGIYAFIYCTKWRSGQVLVMPDSLTDSLTTLKDSATQLLVKYKSGAPVTQLFQLGLQTSTLSLVI